VVKTTTRKFDYVLHILR